MLCGGIKEDLDGTSIMLRKKHIDNQLLVSYQLSRADLRSRSSQGLSTNVPGRFSFEGDAMHSDDDDNDNDNDTAEGERERF